MSRWACLCAAALPLIFVLPCAAADEVTLDDPLFDYDWNQRPGSPIAIRPGDITYLSFDGAETSPGVWLRPTAEQLARSLF